MYFLYYYDVQINLWVECNNNVIIAKKKIEKEHEA